MGANSVLIMSVMLLLLAVPDVTYWGKVGETVTPFVMALATFLTALATFFQSIRNGKKANDAATKAADAATKVEEVHSATVVLTGQAKKIVEQTNGQMTDLREENKMLHETLTQIVAIISAREKKTHAIRATDLKGIAKDLSDHLDAKPRRVERRREKKEVKKETVE